MEGNSCVLNNGLHVSIDWLGFTFFHLSLLEVFDLLGCLPEDFSHTGCGRNGYRSCYKMNGCSAVVLCEGNSDMGIHVEIPSGALSEVLRRFIQDNMIDCPFGGEVPNIPFDSTVFIEFLRTMSQYGASFTRIDLAVDDMGQNYFSIADVAQLLEEGSYLSQFRKFNKIQSHLTDGTETGYTINMGSRESEVFLRVYDKKLEQIEKAHLHPEILPLWVRWELEIKGDKAGIVVKEFLSGNNLGSVTMGILSRYVRFILPVDSNKSRCPLLPEWERFVQAVEPLKLSVKPDPPSIERSIKYASKQFPRTLSKIRYGLGDDIFLDYVNNLLRVGDERITADDLKQADDYRVAMELEQKRKETLYNALG